MLISFEFSNYASFKNEALLSLETSADKEHQDHLISYQKDTFLPVAAVYGANASGKTNINRALTFAIQMVRTSASKPIKSPIAVRPFLLDETSRLEPSTFEFDFVHNDRHFLYRFSCTEEKVLEESLYEFKTARKSKIFERTQGDHYSFTKALKPKLSPLVKMTSSNKLFLSVATAWNSPITRDAYLWFLDGIDTLDRDYLEPEFMERMSSEQSEESKAFALDFLKNADLSIQDYELDIQTKDYNQTPFSEVFKIPSELHESTKQVVKEYQFLTKHQAKDKEDVCEMNLPLQYESRGTITLLAYAPYVYEALKKGKTMVVDELDSALHPELMRYLISIFQNPEKNPKGAQLIFNTHDATQLSLIQFRRDQIYFTEKSHKTGVSRLYSLDDFSPRKDENIQKGYLVGRFGAIPYVREDLLIGA